MQTLWYLIRLFLSLGLGAFAASRIGKHRLHLPTARALDVVLYALLFLMGVNTAQIPDIGNQIMHIGLDALVATALVSVGCILSAFALGLMVHRKSSPTERVRQPITWERLRTPVIMISIVVAGIVFAASTDWFSWFEGSMITVILYLLLFLVGMQMVQHEVDLLPLLRSPLMILLPISTVLGTYLGALALPIFTDYDVWQSLALVSGFGWYSLSGVLISSLGDPQLGAVSFLSNLFRESFAFVLIPLLATVSRASYASISIAGATSMDVTLPLLKKSLGDSVVPLAISHGVIMTLVAPFMIPMWFLQG